jgi:hypothetical protein
MAVQDNLGARLCPLVVVLSTEVLFAETGKGIERESRSTPS